MNTKFVTILTLGALPFIATAMPTKAELDKVSPVVADLMKPEQEALKAGKKSKSEVAAVALDLVGKADGEAAKLLLTKGAYNLYVRDGDFEKAIETLKSFREIVPDMEPQYLANIIESSLRTISRKNGGQLYQLLDETRTVARYRDELRKLEVQAKKTPTDKSLQLKLAEHYAVLNDWSKALAAFEQSSDAKSAAAAKSEKVGDATSPSRQKENAPTILKLAADHWWNYPARKAPEFEKPFRQHAAKLYEQAIATGELVGLNKVQAERRIEEAKALGEGLLSEKNPLGGVQLWEGGPYWAECNVGANQPEEYGYYFWWGDSIGYKRNASNNGWVSVKGGTAFSFSEGSCPTFKKDSSQLQAAGYIDASGNLVAAHDAATAHLGAPWCMPTDADFDALISNCTTTWTTNNGVHGRLIKGKGAFATKSIFLPAAGVGRDLGSVGIGSYGHYWSSSKNSDLSDKASDIGFDSRQFRRYGNYCYVGWPVRPLRRPIQSPFTSPTKIEAFAHTSDSTLAKSKHEMEEKIAAQREDNLYCVIDLSDGPSAKHYPVTYLNAVPKGGWTDEYKTTKLVLRRINSGTYNVTRTRKAEGKVLKDPAVDVCIDNDFYIGVFEVTKKQWEMIGVPSQSDALDALSPVNNLNLDDCLLFVRELNKRKMTNGNEFRIPEEREWLVARGATPDNMRLTGWYREDEVRMVQQVGKKMPNSVGLYDMHGNVKEWCDTKLDEGYWMLHGGGWASSGTDADFQQRTERSRRRNDMGVRVVFAKPSSNKAAMDFAKAKREMEEKIAAQREDKLYCVIDLSGGPNAKHYPITYLNSAPKTGWSDEYKTTKLVLRKIHPGKFKMGSSHDVKLTKPYYLGVFEVTQRQWKLVTGTDNSHFKGNDLCPVEQVSYEMLRGKQAGADWPRRCDVDVISFMGKLQQRTHIQLDLPTEAQWEYACCAGLVTSPLNGDHAWFKDNAAERTHPVGIKMPNEWGLYDMSGNVWEWCLDWHGQLSETLDPRGSTSGRNRVARGGSWSDVESMCTSSVRGNIYPSYQSVNYGFRLSVQPKYTCIGER